LNLQDVRALPKAEVHVHLEGCMEANDIVELAAAAGAELPRSRARLFEFEALEDFLRFLDWQCALVRTPDQLAGLAYRFAQREAASGVGYADLTVSPVHWEAWRTRLPDMVTALDSGFVAAEQAGLPPVGLCVSLSRHQTATEAEEMVEGLLLLRHPRVVALSIDGNESTVGRTSARFARAFARAREAGLRTSVHAGESSGPEGVRDALDILGAERIDHGVRAIEDPELVDELATRRTPLGICPWSNVVLGLFPDRKSHPLERFRRAGVLVSINTDDPALFGVSLDQEYLSTAEAYGWDDQAIRVVARTSIEASFCSEAVRTRLLGDSDRG
jgi:adenosine deaminase